MGIRLFVPAPALSLRHACSRGTHCCPCTNALKKPRSPESSDSVEQPTPSKPSNGDDPLAADSSNTGNFRFFKGRFNELREFMSRKPPEQTDPPVADDSPATADAFLSNDVSAETDSQAADEAPDQQESVTPRVAAGNRSFPKERLDDLNEFIKDNCPILATSSDGDESLRSTDSLEPAFSTTEDESTAVVASPAVKGIPAAADSLSADEASEDEKPPSDKLSFVKERLDDIRKFMKSDEGASDDHLESSDSRETLETQVVVTRAAADSRVDDEAFLAEESPSANLAFVKERLDELRKLASSDVLGTVPSPPSLPSFNTLRRFAAISALRALSPTPLDHLCPTPSEPPFNMRLALNLATYAFRAYHEPPSSAYREIFSVPYGDDGVIFTDFVYPSTRDIASTATGLFLLKISVADAFLAVRINHTLIRDIGSSGHISLLRVPHVDNDDILHIQLYPTPDFWAAPPSHEVSLSLNHIVEEAMRLKRQSYHEPVTLQFQPFNDEQVQLDYFQVSLLPNELRLPFWQSAQPTIVAKQAEELAVTIDASFVPFSEKDHRDIRAELQKTDEDEEDEDGENGLNLSGAIQALGEAIQEAAEEQEEAESLMTVGERRRRDALMFMLRNPLSEGSMPEPEDWQRLADAARTVSERLAQESDDTKVVGVSADPCLFLQNSPTDTELWIFRDTKRRALIVSFRGTEQVSWRDFFTDAQMFLQRWAPGEEIDLTVSTENTVGLTDFVPSMVSRGQPETSVPEDASAVHYGFLRAYLSVQAGLIRAIETLSDGKDDYMLCFTGHSLGGALATIAAADYVVRTGKEACCFSYGAPKVGNFNFARRFNEVVPNAFRIVNDTDLISRMPRSLSTGQAVDRYKHSGRTVLVNDFGDFWIEGEGNQLTKDGKKKMTNPFRERYKDIQEMIEFERQLWEQLLSGRSVRHHMEDSYFTAIQQVVKRQAEEMGNEAEEV